jgi:hypothetical protein
MKTINTYINERLVLSKTKSSNADLSIKPLKNRPPNTSWKYAIIEISVATLESLFGKPVYDCSKDPHFNFGVDKTSIEYYLMVPCEVDNKIVNHCITIYDYDAHEYDDEYDLPIYNKNDVFNFHIGTQGSDKETTDIVIDAFNNFIEENDLSKEIKVYIQKMPWMP